jgi:MFS family permease
VLWPVGFVLGGVGGAVYTLVVIELGHRLNGSGLVRAMGLLVTGYTAGTAGGPALGGWLFDRAGLPGLAAVMTLCGLAGAGLAWRALRQQGRLAALS